MTKSHNHLSSLNKNLQELYVKQIKKSDFIITHSGCCFTKGKYRGSIFDISRCRIFTIPNAYIDILNVINRKCFKEILENIDEDSITEWIKFLVFLIKNEIIIITENENLFRPIANENYNNTNHVRDAIIEINFDEFDNSIFAQILEQLSDCRCQEIQIRIINIVDILFLHSILSKLNEHRFNYIELFFEYNSNISVNDLKNILEIYPILFKIHICNYEKDDVYSHYLSKEGYVKVPVGFVHFRKKKLSELNCGNISPETFSCDPNFIQNESRIFNGCLNKKICINYKGEIKHCLNIATIYGMIGNDKIIDIIYKDDYLYMSKLNKDMIHECCDCEFRYYCTDCRAITKENKLLTKPLNCKYDLIKGKWGL